MILPHYLWVFRIPIIRFRFICPNSELGFSCISFIELWLSMGIQGISGYCSISCSPQLIFQAVRLIIYGIEYHVHISFFQITMVSVYPVIHKASVYLQGSLFLVLLPIFLRRHIRQFFKHLGKMGKVIVSHLGGHNTDRKIGSFQQRPGHIHFFQKNIILKGFPPSAA